MNFTSINEYFYKLYSSVLVILLTPIITFIALYLLPSETDTENLSLSQYGVLVTSMIFLIWISTFVLFNKKIKSARNGQGLREKLEKYFLLTIVRYIAFSLCSVLLAIAFFYLKHEIFTLLFVLQLIVAGVLWPFSSKVCNDLKLRGDEREMVYFKKDSF